MAWLARYSETMEAVSGVTAPGNVAQVIVPGVGSNSIWSATPAGQ